MSMAAVIEIEVETTDADHRSTTFPE